MTPPKYASITKGGAALRLKENRYYYRDAGIWEVEFKEENGKFYSVSDMEHLNGLELIPITKEEWLKGNEGYV